MQLLRDNLTLWTSDMQENDKEAATTGVASKDETTNDSAAAPAVDASGDTKQ